MKFAPALLFSLTLLSGTALAGQRADAAPHGPHADQAGQGAGPVAADEFSKLDANHDGALSRSELAKHPKAAHMAMVDENQDGVLSREEFEQLQGM